MRVVLFEVGPRDGLQNEKRTLPVASRIQFVRDLAACGLREIEVGAFVREDKVPQMARSEVVIRSLKKRPKTTYWSLVPNRRGLERAVEAGAHQICLFTAASDAFAKANIGMTVKQSLTEYSHVMREVDTLRKRGTPIRVRGYVSTAFGCPYTGAVSPKQALRVIEKLGDLGVEQVSIGDTIGVGTPRDVDRVIAPALKFLGSARTAVHFHDTRGTALANALRALDHGVRTFDASAGGLGGCPYAPGASGNLATEDLVYLLEGMGIRTGVDLKKLCRLSAKIARKLGRPVVSRVVAVFLASGKI